MSSIDLAILGIVLEKKGNKFKVCFKNKVRLNDEAEIITPQYSTKVRIVEILNESREDNEIANTNDEAWIEFREEGEGLDSTLWQKEWNWALLRTTGIKNFDSNEAGECTVCE